MLKRHVEKNLKNWFERSSRKPLVIRGARQVGKSTLIRKFAKERGLKLYEINFERNPRFNDLFKSMDMKAILSEIEFFTNQGPIDPANSLIFFDEIQAAPWALRALRYFYEERPEIPIVAAGSLLEFTLSDHTFSMPVGRIEYLFLGPMTFEEYLEAKQETQLLQLLQSYDFSSPFPLSAHNRLLDAQREYFLVGGMPEAIREYLRTNHLEDAVRVQSSIIETYRDDFSKYAKGSDLLRIQKLYDFIPSSVGEKLKYSQIDPSIQARDHKKAIDLLTKARVITAVHHSTASGIPIKAQREERVYKLYFLDIGLMNRMCGVEHIAVSSLSTVDDFINKGKMAEQFIAQHLLYLGHPDETPHLHYWLREGRSSNAEVDFLIQSKNLIIPVEVKSGKSGSLKSLQQFMYEKKAKKALRFDLNLPTRVRTQHKLSTGDQVSSLEYELISLPLYLVEQSPRLINLT